MKFIKIILISFLTLLFVSCGSSKKIVQKTEDQSHIVESIEIKKDTSYSEKILDNLDIEVETIVREYEIHSESDTIMPFLKKETVIKSIVKKKKDRVVEIEEKSTENLKKDIIKDIKTVSKEKQKPYNANWIKYLFWILLLLCAVYIYFALKRKFF